MLIYNLKTSQGNVMCPEDFAVYMTRNPVTIHISNSLAFFLNQAKSQIDTNPDKWDLYKKIINPYEYIFSPVHKTSHCVAGFTPLSRSFFKMVEIANTFKLLAQYRDRPIRTYHLAEAPGGFIEAMAYLRNSAAYDDDVYHSMTLLSGERGVPTWSKIINKYKLNITRTNELGKTVGKKIELETGHDGRGDLLDPANFAECVAKHRNTMDIMSGDGGFDFSKNFEEQEISATRLLLAQILYALMLQRGGGAFVIKFFDVFTYPTIEMLYVLRHFYERVFIVKPCTSRYANSERYIVCTGFMFESTEEYYPAFLQVFQTIAGGDNISRILNVNIPLNFITEVEEANIIIGKQQIDTIHSSLYLMNNAKPERINRIVKENVEKCKQWCAVNAVKVCDTKNMNVFLSQSKSRSNHWVDRAGRSEGHRGSYRQSGLRQSSRRRDHNAPSKSWLRTWERGVKHEPF